MNSLKKEKLGVLCLLAAVIALSSPVYAINIPTDTSIGTWNPVNRIYTLTTDASVTLTVVEDNLTLDGAGHTITGTGTGNGVYLSGRTGVTVKNLTVQKFRYGIYLYNSSNNTLTNNTANANNYYGIYLYYNCSGNKLTDNTALQNRYHGIYLYYNFSGNTLTNNTASQTTDGTGIVIYYSSYNTLTSNTASQNYNTGIYLEYSSNSTLTSNNTSDNADGIVIGYRSNNNTLTGHTASKNYYAGIEITSSNNILTDSIASENKYGIYLWNASDSTLTGNTMSGNTYNFWVYGSSDAHFDHTIDMTNTVDGKPVYYVKNVSNQVYGGYTNAGVFYAINCDNITIKDLMITNNYHGVFLWKTNNSMIENVFASSCYNGLYLVYSSGNTLTCNTFSDNSCGIDLSRCINNQVYNNNFINNTTQARDEGGSGNIFNLDKPIGGNYWSNWNTPDNDHDRFVDFQYDFYSNTDYLPWAIEGGWENQAPVANAGEDLTVEATGPDGAEVTLDGSGSTDPDSSQGTNDDIVSFEWYEGDTLIASGETINYTFSLCRHTVTLVVTDEAGQTSEDDVVITVQDTIPPTIYNILANPSVLWPPNHKMVEVTVTVDCEDNYDPSPDCFIVGVTCNEPVNGPGDGNTEPDWDYTDDPLVVLLRAERAGSGSSRVYTIHIECMDASGNIAEETVDVTVPHDQGKG